MPTKNPLVIRCKIYNSTFTYFSTIEFKLSIKTLIYQHLNRKLVQRPRETQNSQKPRK